MADWREALAAAKPGDYGIIGDPIGHSLSIRLQQPALNRWWRMTGGDPEKTPRYILFHVFPSDVSAFVREARQRKVAGFNVTVPHKTAILPHLDRLEPFAGEVGAVNTVKFENDRAVGHNTDGLGFAQAVTEDMAVSPETALVLGAGGTGQVIVHQLLALDVGTIYWWNRTPERLGPLVDALGLQGVNVKIVENAGALRAACRESDLVVNATSVGLKDGDGLPVEGLDFRSELAAFDVIYHRDTAFLKNARASGALVCGGLPMLLYQGAAAFEIWTGATAPVDLMKEALLQALKEKGIKPVWPSDI